MSLRLAWGPFAALALAGCAVVTDLPGEQGRTQCEDGKDNDGDEIWDCLEPACRAEAHCAWVATDVWLSLDAGLGLPTLPEPMRPSEDDPFTPMIGDAAMHVPDGGLPPDAGTIPSEQPDASIPTEPTEPTEPGGEVMEPAACEMPPCEVMTVTTLRITEITAVVPRSAIPALCFDLTCETLSEDPSFPGCACAPDPIVEIVIARPGESSVGAWVGEPRNDTGEAQWQTDIELPDELGYEVVLKAYDADGTAAQPIFLCRTEVTAQVIEAGELGCEQGFLWFPPLPIFGASMSAKIESVTTTVPVPSGG